MGFSYLGVEEAIGRGGLRMVVVPNIPSPWTEAAKGILHVKGIDWTAVRLDYGSEALKSWSRARNAPVAVLDNEPPRSRWDDILLLAERLAPLPSLLPDDPAERALAFGLAHEICGEEGLGWSRRNQLVHAGLQGAGGFPEKVSQYLGKRYGYRAETPEVAGKRVAALLGMLARRLAAQAKAGSLYYLGNELTAVDIYSAAFMAMFQPLPPDVCAMDETMRRAMETLDAETAAALDPILLEHRDMMYGKHLELPLSL